MKEGYMIFEVPGAGARALIMGCACIIRSKLTPEQIEKFYIYRPEALDLKDDEGNVVFMLDISDGSGHMYDNGADFSHVTTTDGKATITLMFDPAEEDKKGAFMTLIGPGLILLDELEERLLAMLPDLEKEAERAWDIND